MNKLAIFSAPSAPALADALAAAARAQGAETAAPGDLTPDCGAAAFGWDGASGKDKLLSLFSRSLPGLAGRRAAFFGPFAEDDGFIESLTRIGRAAQCIMLPAAHTPEEAAALGAALTPAKEPRPDLAGTAAIVFSTITGNAYKLAAAAAEAIPDHVGPYNIRYVTGEVIDKFDTFVLSYWCNHGTADDDTIALISRLRGKKLIVIGTLGVAVDTAHAAKVCENVTALASAHNTLLGHYLCRGSIDLRRTFARTRIPEGQKGHLSLERFEKQKQSLGHPNEEELSGARTAVAAFLKNA